MTPAYVIYDGQNLYWSRYPEGWLGNLGHAYWYESRQAAERDAEIKGGRVVRVSDNGGLRG